MNTKRMFCNVAKLAALTGIVGGSNYFSLKKMKNVKSERDKLLSYYNVLNQWVQNQIDDKKVVDYFIQNNLHRIAIYGAGPLGRLLYEELKDSLIEVVYFIDKNAENLAYYVEREVISIEDIEVQEEIDVIVITPYYFYDEIIQDFDKNNVTTDVVSLEDIVYSINI